LATCAFSRRGTTIFLQSKLKLAIPSEFLDFNPKIDGARFIGDSGQLAAEINMSALIPAEKVTALVTELIDKRSTK
jgi:hypothetical protein